MAERASTQEAPYSVSSLSAALKGLLERSFSKIYVEGEISGWRRYPSGHCYFTLKDEGAQVSAVMFSSAFERCAVKDALKDGVKVLVYADATVYVPRGNYQLVVRAVRLAGEGELMRRYLELKAKLEGEGLFDPKRKRPLPFMPRRIGLVTSEAGAVVHDMCTVLTRRFPALEIRLYPSLVQGEGASASLTAGLRWFNACRDWRADLIILARGGGSFEDLFCFNDETLVRALAASEIPTISAVGHETDFTLCDFAADCRAGTPSMAAELAVPVLAEITASLESSRTRLTQALRQRGDFFAQHLDFLHAALGKSLETAHHRAALRLKSLSPRLLPALQLRFQDARARLDKAAAQLEAYSPYGVLTRGYSLTTRPDGAVVRSARDLHAGDEIVTRLADGTVSSRIFG